MADDPTPLGLEHAVVIGGSIGGMLAARVLADYFEQVTVLEQDHLAEYPAPRPGVPQSYQVHVLLLRGQQILEQLFPGLLLELVAAGAATVNWTQDCMMLGFTGWERTFASELTTYTCSRVLLEWCIRRRLATYSNVRLDTKQVIGLITNTGKTQITGVQCRCRGSELTETITANLVVDASGRTSQAPQWLTEIGYVPPQETVVNSFLGYASRWYQCPANVSNSWKSVLIWPKPPNDSRVGLIYPVEGDRWVLTLTAPGRDYPPTDEAGFLDFACSIRSPVLYEAIKDAQPISPIYSYRRTENRWRHFEQIKRYPEGFVVLGDAACAFNPIYAQGMTTAALGALTLQQCLREYRQRSFTRHFQQRLATVNASPWLMATGEDFRWSTTEGGQPGVKHQLLHWYVDRVRHIRHRQALQVFLEVVHMVKSPAALFQPAILLPVFGIGAKDTP